MVPEGLRSISLKDQLWALGRQKALRAVWCMCWVSSREGRVERGKSGREKKELRAQILNYGDWTSRYRKVRPKLFQAQAETQSFFLFYRLECSKDSCVQGKSLRKGKRSKKEAWAEMEWVWGRIRNSARDNGGSFGQMELLERREQKKNYISDSCRIGNRGRRNVAGTRTKLGYILQGLVRSFAGWGGSLMKE